MLRFYNSPKLFWFFSIHCFNTNQNQPEQQKTKEHKDKSLYSQILIHK